MMLTIAAVLVLSQAATPPPPASRPESAAEIGIAAIWQKDTVSWEELRPILAERAGAAALEEALLDKRIHAIAAERSITVTDEMIKTEESVLRAQLAPDADRADRLLDEVRARQGLGTVRWRALLWRNAALRAMVARDVQVLPEQIDATMDAAHGPKRRARVIAVPDLRTAQKVADRLTAGEAFADIAAQVSTDSSAARGGLIAPVSRLDPSFPGAFRDSLWALEKSGQTSPPVMAGNGFVIVSYEGDVPGEPRPNADARPAAERAVRLAQERGRMEELARDLVRGIKPTIFDDALADSWKRTNSR